MNGIIKSTVLNVTQRFLKQESKTNKKLDNILNKKFEKVELNEEKYIDLLKYNVLFYKTLSRNTEPIISKWILEKYIPDIDELESDIELINAKCRKYINIAKRDGIENLKEADHQSFNYYDKMGNSEKIKRLQKDYKVLNIYMEVLTMTLRELSLRKEESAEIFLMNPADARMELKREIIVIVNRILAGASKKDDEDVCDVEEPKKDLIDTEFLKRVKLISNAELNDCVEEEFKRILTLENLEVEDAYGFGGRTIYEFAAATVLLEFVKSRTLIEGAMRLTAIGEFGEENFGEFISSVIKNRKIIDLDTWKEACKYFRENKSCVEATTPATIKRTLPASVDIDEYAYMLENADKSEPFRNKLSRRIEPSIIIPAVRIKEVEPEECEIDNSEGDNLTDIDDTKELNEESSNTNCFDEEKELDTDKEVNIEKEINTDKDSINNSDDDHEIHTNQERRREAIKNIERQELEAQRAEREKIEEQAKLNDPVERAKKAVDELKKEISEVESDESEEDSADVEKIVEDNNESYDENNSPEENSLSEENDLAEIAKIAGTKESDETVEEEEPKKKGIFARFGRKNKESEPEENIDEVAKEDKDYKEDEYYNEEDVVEDDTDEEEVEYVDDDYEGDDVEIEEEVVIVQDEEYKKSRKKLDVIVAILIVAIAVGGYFLTINRKRQREAEKQQQIKQEQQLEQQQKEEEQRKKEEAEKIAAEEAKRAEEIEKAKNGGEYYRVYAGSMKEKGHAESLVTNLDKKGQKGEIIKIGDYYKVFVGGDIGVYSEAQKQLSAIKSKGFDGYIEKYDRYCDLKIEDFRLKSKTMDKAQVEEAYNALKEELKSRKNFTDYSKIMDQTYQEIISSKSE